MDGTVKKSDGKRHKHMSNKPKQICTTTPMLLPSLRCSFLFVAWQFCVENVALRKKSAGNAQEYRRKYATNALQLFGCCSAVLRRLAQGWPEGRRMCFPCKGQAKLFDFSSGKSGFRPGSTIAKHNVYALRGQTQPRIPITWLARMEPLGVGLVHRKSTIAPQIGYLKAVWPDICGLVFGRCSTELGFKTFVERQISSQLHNTSHDFLLLCRPFFSSARFFPMGPQRLGSGPRLIRPPLTLC